MEKEDKKEKINEKKNEEQSFKKKTEWNKFKTTQKIGKIYHAHKLEELILLIFPRHISQGNVQI